MKNVWYFPFLKPFLFIVGLGVPHFLFYLQDGGVLPVKVGFSILGASNNALLIALLVGLVISPLASKNRRHFLAWLYGTLAGGILNIVFMVFFIPGLLQFAVTLYTIGLATFLGIVPALIIKKVSSMSRPPPPQLTQDKSLNSSPEQSLAQTKMDDKKYLAKGVIISLVIFGLIRGYLTYTNSNFRVQNLLKDESLQVATNITGEVPNSINVERNECEISGLSTKTCQYRAEYYFIGISDVDLRAMASKDGWIPMSPDNLARRDLSNTKYKYCDSLLMISENKLDVHCYLSNIADYSVW